MSTCKATTRRAGPSSAINRAAPRTLAAARSARGFTLAECLIATAILTISVAAVSTALVASYDQDRYTQTQRSAVDSGNRLMEEISSLPMDATAASSQSIASFDAYTDSVTASADRVRVVADAATQPVAGTSGSNLSAASAGGLAAASGTIDDDADEITVTRRVTVQRLDNLDMPNSASGQLALVSVELTGPDGKPLTLRRLISTNK
jgi:prepilin-type N-terminal cleavage/methylation domain-containing protein